MGLKHWNNIRSQDFISIALSGKRSVTEVKWRLVTEWYSCPNHNICATPSVYLINAASGKSFILTSPNPYSTVCIRNTETGFVRKQHFLPSLPCPLQMGLAHAKRCWRCRGVSSGPLNGRLARRPFSRSLRRTVAELIRGLCLPGVSLAVDAAVLNRLRKCCSRIWRSCWSVVTLGCPGRGRSDTLFVVWNLCLRRTTVLWWQLNSRATSLVDMPALNIPKAWLRSLLLRRGIFETQ